MKREVKDWQEYTFHVRKGIHWQDKPPLNGRELTAYDLEYGLHRLSGLGSGFTTPTPYAFLKTYSDMESITATDKYTLVVSASTNQLERGRRS
jgi:ABC-type transport system substrate-binding protein